MSTRTRIAHDGHEIDLEPARFSRTGGTLLTSCGALQPGFADVVSGPLDAPDYIACGGCEGRLHAPRGSDPWHYVSTSLWRGA